MTKLLVKVLKSRYAQSQQPMTFNMNINYGSLPPMPMQFIDVTERLRDAIWAHFVHEQIGFVPETTVVIKNYAKSDVEMITEIRAVCTKKIACHYSKDGLLLFLERKEDAALTKLFFYE